jgi:hypothetical protein
MNPNTSTLERAFELAKSGRYSSLYDIEREISKEGYRKEQLEGRTLRAQLKALIDAARPTPKMTIRTALSGRAPWIS